MENDNKNNLSEINKEKIQKKQPVVLTEEEKKHLVNFRISMILLFLSLVLLGAIIYQIYGLAVL